MIRASRTAQAATLLAATALVLSACGGGNSNSPSGSKGSNTPSGGGGASKTTSKPLTIGALLPQSGDLAFLGPPQFAGVKLAIQDVNAAGGVLGKPVKEFTADEGDGTPDIASPDTDKLLNDNVDVIVGAAASGVSLSVIDKITGAGVMEISGSNTSPAFDNYPDKGLYFRTAPSDALQGLVLGNLITQDGFSNVAILARQDSYGEGLAAQLAKTIQQKGGTVALKELYSADATEFTAEANKVAAAKPDAVVLISFSEATKIIPALIAAGVGPQDVQTYFVDGDTADYSKDFPPGTLTGVKATFPTPPALGNSFKKRLLQINPKLTDFTYGPQVYDAVILSALAATAAGSVNGKDIASKMTDVSEGGAKCTSYKACVALLKQGKDIDYEGVSGPVDFNSNGSPSKATIGIQEYTKNNKYHQIDSVTGVLK